MRVFGSSFGRAGLLAVVITAVGCSSPTAAELELFQADGIEALVGADVVLLTMKFVPEVSMQALYEGRVTADDGGCLRLDTNDRHTVVWPKGYGVESANGGFQIVDDAGAVIGPVGGEFSIPGGEVSSLHDGLGFTEADRALAEAHCPGKFWIMGTD
ncbi:MAG: hypothetical protein KY466_15115 [Gemmatimonadetes bacterium]|nr:hypothetical protein [Gemmatimonadota bacterium]